MLHSLPPPHSSTVPPPASDSLDMQSASMDYASREPQQSSDNHYAQDQHPQHRDMTASTATAPSTAASAPPSPVKPASPTRSYSNVAMSQPTTPKPTGSPILQPLHSITQPLSPNQGYPPQEAPPMQAAAAPPYLINNNIRRKRRESDYTSDTPTFGMTKYNGNIYATDKSTVLDVHIQSKVDRGFFLADNDWTCYRRNYFQVSSSFSLQGVVVLYDGQGLPCLVQDQDVLHEVDQFYLGITARLSDCDKQILLIQHTAKRDKGPQNTPEPRPIRPGGNLSFSSVGANQSIVTFERIQFKSATANNGKRRAAQQYYVVVMELFAKTRYSGKMIPVASTQSQPLVVRGRSPGHYAESHGSGASSSSALGGSDGSAVVGGGGPMRRQQQYRHHPSSHSYPPPPPPPPQSSGLTSPPMIPGHHPHTPIAYHHQHHHAAPPSAATSMYASEYPPTYDYPPPHTHSSNNSNSNNGTNGMHYVYAPPPHANVSMAPSGPPPQHPLHPPPSNGPYDYHTSPTSPHHQSPLPQQHPYPPPGRPETPTSSVYDHPYPSPSLQQQQQQHHHHHHPYASLPPPPMHRSESAPSTYDHFKDDEEHQQQQHQQWARFRMSSTPGQQLHPGNHSPTESPYLSRPAHDHAYYSQPQQPMPYYHHPPPNYGPSIPPPVDTTPYQQGYTPGWQQWRPMDEYAAKGSEDDATKMETKQH
ncbi:hypothetical protein [Absidia glauca]|uniref:NDT80 domain-containing protein n=1 Tax=Absidia glauca TaxID=4829 RepID=A0A168N2Q7_ABSGL|nr:hypothetical protein [Absidia glauca]